MNTRQPALTIACVLLALGLGLPALAAATAGSADDFFVVLVYARNLLEGHGFVNQIGGPVVDGFTSPLDVLVKTLALASSPSDGVAAAWWATVWGYLAALAACGWAAVRLVGPPADGHAAWTPLAALLGAAALALAPGLAEGSAYLLEAPLVALLWLGLLTLVARPGEGRWRGAAVLAVLLLIARPEGLVLGPVALACLPAGSRRRALLTWAPLAMLLVGLHYLTFGQWAPNAFYAKASNNQVNELVDGAKYIAAFVETRTGLATVFAWGIGLTGAAAGRAPRAPALAASACLAIVAGSGGDGYMGTRLLLPFSLAALASALVCLPLARGPHAWRGWGAAGCLAALIALTSARLPLSLWTAGVGPAELALRGADFAGERRLAERLASVDPAVHLGHLHLQSAAWFAQDLAVLDLSGLNDPTIAHLPLDGPVAFGREALLHGLDRGVNALHLSPSRLDGFPLASRPFVEVLDDPPLRTALFGELPFTPERLQRLEGWLPATLLEAGGPGRHANLLIHPDHERAMVRAGFQVGRWSAP